MADINSHTEARAQVIKVRLIDVHRYIHQQLLGAPSGCIVRQA